MPLGIFYGLKSDNTQSQNQVKTRIYFIGVIRNFENL